MSNTAADERPSVRLEAAMEALIEATAQTFCLVKSA
jgi:hypothetical protein